MNELASCIIAAAGQSKRMGSKYNKQFLKLTGAPVLAHTWRVFARLSFIKEIILVANESELELCEKEVIDPYKSEGEERCEIKIVPGGSNRQQSVFNGILEASRETSVFIVHDGARPLISEALILNTFEQALEHFAAVAAVPVKDTIKFVNENGFIEKTPPRDKLWAVQTPQAFEKTVLKKAHETAIKDSFVGFDDSSLVERTGIFPRIVESTYENIKITTKEDLEIANKILAEKGDMGIINKGGY